MRPRDDPSHYGYATTRINLVTSGREYATRTRASHRVCLTVADVNAEPTSTRTPCAVDWRVKARELFPELEAVFAEDWSVHVFLTELLDIVREAHHRGDSATLDRGYAFARWCLDQPRRFLADAAIVSFYEHLFDDWELRHEVAERLPEGIGERVWPLWEWRLPAERLAELERLVGRK